MSEATYGPDAMKAGKRLLDLTYVKVIVDLAVLFR